MGFSGEYFLRKRFESNRNSGFEARKSETRSNTNRNDRGISRFIGDQQFKFRTTTIQYQKLFKTHRVDGDETPIFGSAISRDAT